MYSEASIFRYLDTWPVALGKSGWDYSNIKYLNFQVSRQTLLSQEMSHEYCQFKLLSEETDVSTFKLWSNQSQQNVLCFYSQQMQFQHGYLDYFGKESIAAFYLCYYLTHQSLTLTIVSAKITIFFTNSTIRSRFKVNLRIFIFCTLGTNGLNTDHSAAHVLS